MSSLGFNVLGTVQTAINKQAYQLEKWLSRERNANGYEVDTYSAPIDRKAGIYPLNREQVQKNGLNQDKIYIQLFDVELVGLLDRSTNADRIIYNGHYWHPLPSSNDFMLSGGWNQVIAVKGKAHLSG